MDPQTTNPAPVAGEPPAQAANPVTDVISAVQNGKNVLVTVGSAPNVDELASALGLTFLLGKLDKHATAVFSGKIPSAMEFLDPEKTFESSVDSLRDFIIALDKEKADKLRYKVEDEVVKIFITPYRTILSEKDLDFSQGDFNIDVVIALGVEKREDLDKAITAHGRILHDATVITINAGAKTSNLGAIDWSDPEASSVAEMLMALADAFGGNLLDPQIGTAFLTGIVAETNRFSNEKTSPRVMNLSAQLMAAGANQQLIATNLRQEGMISQPIRKKSESPHDDDGEMVLEHGGADEGAKDKKTAPTPKDKQVVKKDEKNSDSDKNPGEAGDSASSASQQLKDTVDKASETELEQVSDENGSNDAPQAGGAGLAEGAPEPSKPQAKKTIEPLPSLPSADSVGTPGADLAAAPADKPSFGGTLNATTAGAEEAREAQEAREASENTTLLSHDDTSADKNEVALEEARKAVEDAETAAPFSPANQPIQAINSQPLPTVEPTETLDTSVSAMQSTAAPVPAEASESEPSPVDAFMQPHADGTQQPAGLNMPAPVSAPPLPPLPGADGDGAALPPLPPLPDGSGAATPADNSLPPLPPLPGAPVDPAAVTQPQINPGFMQDMPQSQNSWTQAGDDLAAKQAGDDAARQQKMDQMTQQYDQAVDKNREINGLPPLNNPAGSGLPPLPPT